MPQESKPEQVRTGVQEARQDVAATRRPWYSLSRTAKRLLLISAVVLLLFTVLACWVHAFPVNRLDLLIPHELQENPAPWLHVLMALISYPGSTPLLSALIVLTAVIFWILGDHWASDVLGSYLIGGTTWDDPLHLLASQAGGSVADRACQEDHARRRAPCLPRDPAAPNRQCEAPGKKHATLWRLTSPVTPAILRSVGCPRGGSTLIGGLGHGQRLRSDRWACPVHSCEPGCKAAGQRGIKGKSSLICD
jgi:hypothetical protein